MKPTTDFEAFYPLQEDAARDLASEFFELAIEYAVSSGKQVQYLV